MRGDAGREGAGPRARGKDWVAGTVGESGRKGDVGRALGRESGPRGKKTGRAWVGCWLV